MIYAVKRGDTLSEIAYAKGYRGQKIWQAVDRWTRENDNIKKNGNLIFAGDKIKLSDAGPSSSQNQDVSHTSSLTGNQVLSSNVQFGLNASSWMDIAKSQLNVSEIRGSRDNPNIVGYHATTTLGAKDDETPWCASFVNWVIEKAGYKGTDSAAAISWANWGTSSGLKPGAVVVIRNRNTGGHHVGFFVEGKAGNLVLLGGNQGDQVKYSRFGSNWDIISARMPSNVA